MSRFAGPKSRQTSPFHDAFTTATETSFQGAQDIIHSTPLREATTTGRFPLHYDEHPDMYDRVTGSEDISMSIELGRGLKRGARAASEDLSSNAIFSFGQDESQYDLVDTPPVRARNVQRRSEGTLRKEASVRRATESTKGHDALKRNTNGTKRAVSETLARPTVENEGNLTQATATFTFRGTRFAAARHVSSSYNVPKRYSIDGGLDPLGNQTPRKSAAGNPTVQSATYTAGQSFMLPDLPNITELVSEVRKNGTPAPKTNPAPRSRFTSASYRPEATSHVPVTSIAVPQDEQAVFASIQTLSAKIAQLEQEKSEAQKYMQEYEEQVMDLRAQLQVAGRRPDSGLGSEEDDTTGPGHSRAEKTRLSVKVKAAEERLQRSERKASVSAITVTRITKERDTLLSNLANAFNNNAELEGENEELRETIADLLAQNTDLKDQLHRLEGENEGMREEMGQSVQKESKGLRSKPSSSRVGGNRTSQNSGETMDIAEGLTMHSATTRSKAQDKTRSQSRTERTRRASQGIEEDVEQDLASRVYELMRKQREEATEQARESRDASRQSTSQSRTRSRSAAASKRDRFVRQAPASNETQASDNSDGIDHFDETRKSQTFTKYAQQFEADLTQLSDIDPVDVANLRKKLEEEMRAKHDQKKTLSSTRSEADLTTRTATQQGIFRKSSLKDTTSATEGGTGKFSLDELLKVNKTVRVRSPHTADEISHTDHQTSDSGELSFISNISRRRRPSTGTEGMTSEFIIPDITIHRSKSASTTTAECIQHSSTTCTSCAHDTTSVEIPTPVPVTARADYGDAPDFTLRPSQSPPLALATVIKLLEDEITHLKLQREAQNRLYHLHNPALAKRARHDLRRRIDRLTARIERRCDQVYALYDVLEGQKGRGEAVEGGAGARAAGVEPLDPASLEDTLQSLGIDPAELSGRTGRAAPAPLRDEGDSDEELDLPFEGFSELDSDGEEEGPEARRV